MKLLDIIFESVVDMNEAGGRRPMTKDEFIKQSKEVHGDKYRYDNIKYIDGKTKVNITCPIHGDFPQRPNSHLSGRGCDKCARESRKSNTEEFTKDAQSMKAHQNDDGTPKYTYDNVVYIASDKKVNITCPIHSPLHGDFPQTPRSHLQGVGCPWCKESKGEKRVKQMTTNSDSANPSPQKISFPAGRIS